MKNWRGSAKSGGPAGAGHLPGTVISFVRAAVIVCVLGAVAAAAQDYPRSDDHRAWNKPAAPFRIAGPIHYVGTFDLASYLITTSAGHILIDSGLESNAAQLRSSIETLGFAVKDVRILLNTQAHFDHAAGLAAFKSASGARMLASAPDAALLESGGRNDPAFGDELTFPPVKVDGILKDGQQIALGDVTLTAHMTPGHSPGTTSWTTTVQEGGRSLRVLFAGSTSIPSSDMVLVGNPRYPTVVADYKRTFAFLKAQQPDIWLTQHASAFGLHDKAARLKAGASPHPFVDPDGYTRWLTGSERSFLERLATK
jgi:metallo-beta-lactamase class B